MKRTHYSGLPGVPAKGSSFPLAAEQRFELLLTAIKDYAIYLLDVDGYVNSWNSGAERFKGYTAEEIIGQHFSRFYTPEDRAAGLPELALRTAAENGRFEAEGWRVRKDGTRFWTSVVIDPVLDDNGKLIGFAKITRDITERRLAQEEIDRSREALHQAQKMEAIGQLTGGVAHDFNNLLTIIRSSAELLRRRDLPEEKRGRYVQAIVETAERAGMLTKQLLAFARRQPLRPADFDAVARVKDMGPILETSVGSAVTIEFLSPSEPCYVHADPNQFETALLNMAINARDAMPKGGTLRIGVSSASGVPPVRRHAGARGAFVAVTVTDSGTGMAPETLARIFEPFFTTKGVNQGTGLGLSQVHGFAKQSGGEIDVITKLGEGSTFTLYLPRAEQCAEDTGRSVGRADAVPAELLGILLVEDNKTVGEFAYGILSELGHRVTWVTDGGAALEKLEADAAGFDIVFSDVVMPGITGIELAQEVRRRWPDLRIVLTSGYSDVLAQQGWLGFELLEKPYSIQSVVALLRG